jgi:cytosine/adenosine deaminase-related metal-dependent hydrolase
MLLARLDLGLRPAGTSVPGDWMTAREALELATLGGARVLGRDDVGSLEAGKCADFFTLDLGAIEYAGALHDPVAATVLCAPTRARFTVVHGRVVVEEGRLTTVDVRTIVERHNRLAARVASARA